MSKKRTGGWVKWAGPAVLLCCAAVRCAGATRFHEKISVKYQELPVASVLDDVQRKSGVRLTVRAADRIGQAALVDYEASDQAVGRILTRILLPRRMKLHPTGDNTANVLPRSDYDEYRPQRQEIFGFKQKPQIAWEGDNVTIRFETTGLCDVTVAVEDGAGRIIRHLACGVLGMNAPEPFVWNSKRQVVIWDGKDDAGTYVDNKDPCTIRVSLGLRPRLERTLNWMPEKRLMPLPPRIAACEEGVCLAEGMGVDKVVLFDHDGAYKRTIYPFPRDKLQDVRGLEWETAPQDGTKVPKKHGFQLATLLTSGDSAISNIQMKHKGGMAATAMAAHGKRIVLAMNRINRLTVDGTTGGKPLSGARTTFVYKGSGKERFGSGAIPPTSAAVSPDEKWLYLAGYGYRPNRVWSCHNAVQRVPLDGDGEPELFPPEAVRKTKDGTFHVASSVDCDADGNVYVGDYINDRIQVFSSSGVFLKSVPVTKPAIVRIHRRTQDICCISWMMYHPSHYGALRARKPGVVPTVYQFGPLAKPELKKKLVLPIRPAKAYGQFIGRRGYLRASGEIDSWADKLTVWVCHEVDVALLWGVASGDGGRLGSFDFSTMVLREENGEMKVVRNFGRDVKDRLKRGWPSDYSIQRLFVNPRTGTLYVKENRGAAKALYNLLEVDPASGRVKIFPIPFDAEDICFDRDGRLYLRTDKLVARFDSVTMREIPWDYGRQARNVGFASIGSERRKLKELTAGLETPGQRPVCWHQGGMAVSPKGHLAVSCVDYGTKREKRFGLRSSQSEEKYGSKAYTPSLFPGRLRWQSIHIWDRHGKLVVDDAFPGTGILDGVGIDQHDNLYILSHATRRLDGKRVFNPFSGTVIKAAAGKARVVSTARTEVPLTEGSKPERPPELAGRMGNGWVTGAEWFYGGIGFSGFNGGPGGGCACWQGRFWLDYLGRSFAPEIGRHSVAVLDTNGNLILRIGKYGNVDDGMPCSRKRELSLQDRPLIKDGGLPGSERESALLQGPPDPRSIGGDETGLFYPAYVASHTDRRLFIADAGNFCIRSLKLGYHAEETVALKDLQNQRNP